MYDEVDSEVEGVGIAAHLIRENGASRSNLRWSRTRLELRRFDQPSGRDREETGCHSSGDVGHPVDAEDRGGENDQKADPKSDPTEPQAIAKGKRDDDHGQRDVEAGEAVVEPAHVGTDRTAVMARRHDVGSQPPVPGRRG